MEEIRRKNKLTDFDNIFGDQQNESIDITNLDVSDFYVEPNRTLTI